MLEKAQAKNNRSCFLQKYCKTSNTVLTSSLNRASAFTVFGSSQPVLCSGAHLPGSDPDSLCSHHTIHHRSRQTDEIFTRGNIIFPDIQGIALTRMRQKLSPAHLRRINQEVTVNKPLILSCSFIHPTSLSSYFLFFHQVLL